jgi:lipopolysaccharide export LptBFGC system permease protein LptF
VYNRRGVVGGVAWALGIFFLLLFGRGIFLALGKGMRLDPFLAPWVPNIIIGVLGMILLWMRSTNRDFASLFSRRK